MGVERGNCVAANTGRVNNSTVSSSPAHLRESSDPGGYESSENDASLCYHRLRFPCWRLWHYE